MYLEQYMNTAIEIAKEAESIKDKIEIDRILPDQLISKVKKEGLVKRWATKVVGGHEASIKEVSSMISDMAYYNGSLAWVVAVTGCSSLFSGFIDEVHAKPLFSDQESMIGGFAGPAGVGVKTNGGLMVSGQWSWGSGINHCTHIVGGLRLMEDDNMVGTAIAMFHPDEVEIIDNWNVLGLKGTRSVDYKCRDVFIPEGRWFNFPVTTPTSKAPLYRFSFLGALSLSVAAVALGLSRRALDEIKSLAQIKSPFGQGRSLSKRPIFQSELAKIEGAYLAAQALFDSVIDEAEKEVEIGQCGIKTKGKIRLASSYATSSAFSVVQTSFDLAGGSAIWKSNKLEELIRDMNVVKQHGLVNDLNYRTVGAVLLGEDVPITAL